MFLNFNSGVVLPLFSLVSGLGIFIGQHVFEETDTFKVGQQLFDRREMLLDVEGTQDDDVWLVLAQKYREHGVTNPKPGENLSNQKNPGFLSEEEWNTYAKDKSGFDKDSELAEIIKRTCKEAISKQYTHELFDKVKQWCKLNLPPSSRRLLKIQKDNGNCRFLMYGLANTNGSSGTSTTSSSEGFFAWADSVTQRSLMRMLLQDLNYAKSTTTSSTTENSRESWAKKIIEQCKSNKDKILKLSTGKIENKTYWQVKPEQASA